MADETPSTAGTATEAPPPPGVAPVVEFNGVTKTYNAGQPDAFTAIRDITFRVDDTPAKGEFIGILGPSGCGKSTILRLIAGLGPQHPATGGTVEVRGRPVVGPGRDRGMVFQDYTSFAHRTVLQNIVFGLECEGMPRKEREGQAMEWIERVGLNPQHDAAKYPHELSGGMRQRVAIARTLILEPRIVLMDEPFGALDPVTRFHMQDQLISLWREVHSTVFFVTHDVAEAVYLADRIFILSNSPGTILRETKVPAPSRPSRTMRREKEFQETVYEIAELLDTLEEGKD